MKQFKVTWYSGSVEMVCAELNTKVVKAENIDSVKFISVLPKEEKERYCDYYRTIHFSETRQVIDYGSWSNFIEIKEIK